MTSVPALTSYRVSGAAFHPLVDLHRRMVIYSKHYPRGAATRTPPPIKRTELMVLPPTSTILKITIRQRGEHFCSLLKRSAFKTPFHRLLSIFFSIRHLKTVGHSRSTPGTTKNGERSAPQATKRDRGPPFPILFRDCPSWLLPPPLEIAE